MNDIVRLIWRSRVDSENRCFLTSPRTGFDARINLISRFSRWFSKARSRVNIYFISVSAVPSISLSLFRFSFFYIYISKWEFNVLRFTINRRGVVLNFRNDYYVLMDRVLGTRDTWIFNPSFSIVDIHFPCRFRR